MSMRDFVKEEGRGRRIYIPEGWVKVASGECKVGDMYWDLEWKSFQKVDETPAPEGDIGMSSDDFFCLVRREELVGNAAITGKDELLFRIRAAWRKANDAYGVIVKGDRFSLSEKIYLNRVRPINEIFHKHDLLEFDEETMRQDAEKAEELAEEAEDLATSPQKGKT